MQFLISFDVILTPLWSTLSCLVSEQRDGNQPAELYIIVS